MSVNKKGYNKDYPYCGYWKEIDPPARRCRKRTLTVSALEADGGEGIAPVKTETIKELVMLGASHACWTFIPNSTTLRKNGGNMTKLARPVKREFSSGLFDRRSLFITLDTDGYIRLREKSNRRTYSISFEALYLFLVKAKKEARGK